MDALSLNDAVTVRPDVLFRYVDDETVLLNSETGTYFGLDAIGTRIWQLLTELGSLNRVFDVMLDEYSVSATDLERDLLALTRQLHEKGLVDIRHP